VRWRSFKTRVFARWARKEGIADRVLLAAVAEMESGLFDARLGGGLFKKRVGLPGSGKRGGARTIVAGNFRDRWIFLYGFAKNERDNIDQKEERDLKRIGGALLKLDWAALEQMIESGKLLEVKDG
jgi:hypothetical protein